MAFLVVFIKAVQGCHDPLVLLRYRRVLSAQQLPHHVLVLVGKNLFPYLLEYRHPHDTALATSTTGLRPAHHPLVRYEIYDVSFAAAIDPKQFQFERREVQWSDETSLVLERWKTQAAGEE